MSSPLPGEINGHETREFVRFLMADAIIVTLDGNPATLIDLSVCGAQIVTAMTIRPNQRVRVSLPGSGPTIRVAASVRWANFEIPKAGPCYRAGLKFLDADPDAISRFIEANKRT